jgi:amino acid transporter
MGFSLAQVFVFILLVILVVAFWKINTRVGYPGWLALLILIPIVNIVYILYLTYRRWLITQK